MLNGLLILLYTAFLVPESAHAFHLSKSMMEYNEQEKALQISMHIFLDDLEDALRLEGNDQLFLCTEKEAPEAEGYMEAYLRKHFLITVNGEVKSYNFLGKEPSEDFQAAWCYIEIENIEELKELTIKHDLLMEVFDDQKNVVQLVGPNRKRGTLLFQKGREEETVKF